MRINRNYCILALLTLLLAGCASKPSRYSMSQDAYPQNPPKLSSLEDAYPHIEPLSRAGNKDYTVNGKRYKVWLGIKHYQQIGMASWYGAKFQGHRTSNGDIYDMYSMSAAHKHLPLPSYVRVTNLSNNKSVIVRVNDRGPFHSNRIIDLSYAAAYKLDILSHGTAKVKVTLIDPNAPKAVKKVTLSNRPKISEGKGKESSQKKVRTLVQPDNFYVQLLAFKDTVIAEQRRQTLVKQGYQAVVVHSGAWQKLRVGPYSNRKLAERVRAKMRQSQYKDAFIVKIKHTN